MNPSPNDSSDPRRIRAQIDQTRQRMDHTIDALGRRFQGRHLIDEALHFVRTKTENSNMTQITNRLKTSADATMHTVVDTVKANPIPSALIGAGVAWYLYSQVRPHRESDAYTYEDPIRGYDEAYNGGSDVGEPVAGTATGVGERLREKAGHLRDRSREAMASARESLHHVGARAGEIKARVRDQSHVLMQKGRERVVTTVDQHPLESGLACLALGVIIGISLPTSRRVRTAVGPGARQLRDRSREVIERGRNVARTAAHAAMEEAEAQGLTPRALSEKAGQVAQKAGTVAQEYAREENLFQPAANSPGTEPDLKS
jgi:hypothetical protein